MKTNTTVKGRVWFPILLVLDCLVIHLWQRSLTDMILPYLPKNEYLPVGILTGLMILLTFFTTLVLLKQGKTKHPILFSFVSTFAMALLIVAAALFFLSYAARRYAGILPVPILPDYPIGIVATAITALCTLHLTALLITRFCKQKPTAGVVLLSVIGWIVLNACLFLLTL